MPRHPRTFWAAEYAYGRNAVDAEGLPICDLHRFTRKEDRTAWVRNRRTDYPSERGYREAIFAEDAVVRRIRDALLSPDRDRRRAAEHCFTHHAPNVIEAEVVA